MNATEKDMTCENSTLEQWDAVVRPDCPDHLRGLDNRIPEMYESGMTALEASNQFERQHQTAKADRRNNC